MYPQGPNSNSTKNKLPLQPNTYKGFHIFGVMSTVGFAINFMVYSVKSNADDLQVEYYIPCMENFKLTTHTQRPK